MNKSSVSLLAVIFALAAPLQASANEAPGDNNTLTGNWGGARTTLADKGVTVDATYKLDILGNVSGGIKDGARALDNLDVVFNLDGEKILNSKGTTALIHLLNNDGGQPNGKLVGSGQGIDSIEVPKATGKLYQAWIQQALFDDRLSFRLGLYDLNSEFYVTPASGLFIHPTFGIGTEVAQSGANGPSIFPYTSVGLRVKVQPTAETYAQAVALDGVPGDPGNPKGTHVQFNGGDGTLWVGEAGYVPGGDKPTGKLAAGGWYYTSRASDNDGSGTHHNGGAYVIGEHQLIDNLSGFVRLGFANPDVNQFNYAWSAGLVYTGLFPGRPDGQLGLAFTGAHNAGSYRDAQAAAGTPADAAETTAELTYSDNLTPWFTVQPDVQYIINPGTDPAHDNAVIIGSRFTVKF